MRDPVLKNKIIKTNQAVWEEFANSPKNGAARLKLFYLSADLKYFARPSTVPQIIKETDFLD